MTNIISFFSQYIYLLSGLYFFVWWIFFFFLFRKNWVLQKRMLVISSIFMVITPFLEQAALVDWWRPKFIYSFPIHFEDLLFGFAISGTTLGIYFLVSRIRLRKTADVIIISKTYKNIVLIATIFLSLIPFYFLNMSSFWTNIICLIFLSLCILVKIPRIITPMAITGAVLTILILPGYFLASYLHPGWIQEYWLLTGWPGKLLLTIPIGEYVYYFLYGFFLPAFYELFFNGKKIKIIRDQTRIQ